MSAHDSHTPSTTDPLWRVSMVEHLPAELLDRLEGGIDRVFADVAFPTPYVDIELVGSYTIGRADEYSDVDINLAWASAREQVAAYPVFLEHAKRWVPRMVALRHAVGIMIEVGMRNHDSRTYTCVFSLRERRLYGRTWGSPAKYVRLRWTNGRWTDKGPVK